MFVALIVAMDINGVIGKNNDLPWYLPADLKHVKHLTTGNTVIMGRKNYESIGRPLPNRRNIIITRNKNYEPPNANGNCHVFHDPLEALQSCANEDEDNAIFIFGGAEIYKLFMPWVKVMYITRINHLFEGDTYFPNIDWDEWEEINRFTGSLDEDNPERYEFEFITYIRKKHIRKLKSLSEIKSQK